MVLSQHLLACATCMPSRESDVFLASNMAILFMVIVVFSMFAVVIRIMFNFARKARQFENSPQ